MSFHQLMRTLVRTSSSTVNYILHLLSILALHTYKLAKLQSVNSNQSLLFAVCSSLHLRKYITAKMCKYET